MNLRTGLAGLVALVWAIVAVQIGNGVGGPPEIACLSASSTPQAERLASVGGDVRRPPGRVGGAASGCRR